MSVPIYLARHAERIADPVERQLWIDQQIAASEYDAAIEGAYHHNRPRDAADAAYYAAMRAYDATSAALIEYRRR